MKCRFCKNSSFKPVKVYTSLSCRKIIGKSFTRLVSEKCDICGRELCILDK